jgi:hypothetical protein
MQNELDSEAYRVREEQALQQQESTEPLCDGAAAISASPATTTTRAEETAPERPAASAKGNVIRVVPRRDSPSLAEWANRSSSV